MKLVSFEVYDFRSIRKSEIIKVDDITCLVGKNESGKTAVLQALYRENPIIESDSDFDLTTDFPRRDVEDYRLDLENGKRRVAKVIEVNYELEDVDVVRIEELFGPKALISRQMSHSRYYNNTGTFELDFNEAAAKKYFVENADLAESVRESIDLEGSWIDIQQALESAETTEEITALLAILKKFKGHDASWYCYNEILADLRPKYLYFDEYYQMKGHENVEALKSRIDSKTLEKSDHPLIGLINLARLKIDDLLNVSRTLDLTNKLEGAGNHLTSRILKYWSQNRHIQMKFDVRPAMPEDPDGMTSGTNIWGRVHDTVHWATTELGSRSTGFLWFFSFLAWYENIKTQNSNVILLLDEPGMSLHGKAQADLLRYIEEELSGNHQVVYTTHSPFMVDSNHFERVRIVQDQSIDSDEALPPEKEGSKVLTNIFDASDDSLFPLQGALGYEIQQSLFIGPNSLIVEGPSDLLYIREMSTLLEREGRIGLSEKWVITPVGGSTKVPTFVALIGPQEGVNLATLIDVQTSDKQQIEDLYKKKLLRRENVLTYGDFTGTKEADVEDMFDRGFYLQLINGEFKTDLQKAIKVGDLNKDIPRTTRALEEFFDTNPLKKSSYSHYRPARFLSENMTKLGAKISDDTKDRFEAAFVKLNELL